MATESGALKGSKRRWPEIQTIRFVEQYEMQEVLWNVRLSEYKNKDARAAAINQMIHNLKIPGISADDVIKKINNIRTTYQQEKTKIRKSVGTAENMYESSLQWFHIADRFLPKVIKPREYLADLSPCDDLTEQSPNSNLPAPSQSTITSLPPPTKKQRVVGPLVKQNEPYPTLPYPSLPCKFLETPQDDWPSISKHWGEKIMTLDAHQRLFAEKAINDVLFEASLGNLNRYSVTINNEGGPYQHPVFCRSTSGDISSHPSPAESTQDQHFSEGACIHSIAYVTVPSDDVGKALARKIVENKYAACVNIIPKVTSVYEWKGEITEDSEALMIIKTRTSRVEDLIKFVRENHPYEVCEVITTTIDKGNPPYLKWINDVVPEIK